MSYILREENAMLKDNLKVVMGTLNAILEQKKLKKYTIKLIENEIKHIKKLL